MNTNTFLGEYNHLKLKESYEFKRTHKKGIK
jgi:hypothetical protein